MIWVLFKGLYLNQAAKKKFFLNSYTIQTSLRWPKMNSIVIFKPLFCSLLKMFCISLFKNLFIYFILNKFIFPAYLKVTNTIMYSFYNRKKTTIKNNKLFTVNKWLVNYRYFCCLANEELIIDISQVSSNYSKCLFMHIFKRWLEFNIKAECDLHSHSSVT